MSNSGSEYGFLNWLGPSTTYIHDQMMVSETWVIVHAMNKRPSVTVVDSGGRVVVGDVQYIDNNTVEIYFSAPFAGKAYLN